MRRQQPDPDLAAIATLERQIIEAQDQRMQVMAVDPAEAIRLRPGVVALATLIGQRLRAEHLARQGAHHDA